MSDRKATTVLKTVATRYGYVIREEYWPKTPMHAELLSGEPDEVTDAVIDEINRDHPPTLMVTCYTNEGHWIGDEKTAEYLCRHCGIAPEPIEPREPGILRPCSIGFCEREQKWYGWSHRAIYGFGIGSEVKRGDVAYVPTDWDDLVEDAIRFWSEDHRDDLAARIETDEDGRRYVYVSWRNSSDPNLIPNPKARGQISGAGYYPPDEWGRGEWTAETLDDARQMAIDFAEGVA